MHAPAQSQNVDFLGAACRFFIRGCSFHFLHFCNHGMPIKDTREPKKILFQHILRDNCVNWSELRKILKQVLKDLSMGCHGRQPKVDSETDWTRDRYLNLQNLLLIFLSERNLKHNYPKTCVEEYFKGCKCLLLAYSGFEVQNRWKDTHKSSTSSSRKSHILLQWCRGMHGELG